MTCKWGNCNNPAYYVFIMGCRNMHISERPFCAQHSLYWERFIKRGEAACYECWAEILAMETVPAWRVTHLVNPVPV